MNIRLLAIILLIFNFNLTSCSTVKNFFSKNEIKKDKGGYSPLFVFVYVGENRFDPDTAINYYLKNKSKKTALLINNGTDFKNLDEKHNESCKRNETIKKAIDGGQNFDIYFYDGNFVGPINSQKEFRNEKIDNYICKAEGENFLEMAIENILLKDDEKERYERVVVVLNVKNKNDDLDVYLRNKKIVEVFIKKESLEKVILKIL